MTILGIVALLLGCGHAGPKVEALPIMESFPAEEPPVIEPLSVEAPPPHQREIIRDVVVEEADEDHVPQECRWNLSGTYGVAKPFSKQSATARFYVSDDGEKLIFKTVSLSQSADANTSENDDSDAFDALEFTRTPDGIVHQKIGRVQLNDQRECLVPFTAKIVSCHRGELTVELDSKAQVTDACDVIERSAPIHLRFIRRNPSKQN